MPNLRGWEWLILLLLVVVLFGAKRLPDAARGVGRSLRIFKAETKGLADDAGDASATAGGTHQAHPADSAQPGTPAPPAQIEGRSPGASDAPVPHDVAGGQPAPTQQTPRSD